MRTKKYFNLLHQLAVAQFKLKDQSAMLGFLWSFLHPLVLLGILFAMFRFQTGKGIALCALSSDWPGPVHALRQQHNPRADSPLFDETPYRERDISERSISTQRIDGGHD
jgi:hypothetical protein